jgi:hypothetical protein
MLALTRMGAVMVPPMPAFYNHPQCVGDIIDHVAMRVLDQFGIDAPVDTPRWSGLPHRDRSLEATGHATGSRRADRFRAHQGLSASTSSMRWAAATLLVVLHCQFVEFVTRGASRK